ncbi:MAG: tRNA (adenine(57)-N(1)/adenine(58)-N(1))-methyltransferase TrmI [Methanomassiliicoccales archaeon PtaU1.Bin124]|nr:MAG: tRNA (adenine(57)-N(1)/adenine(58)-N(1))-methyltransferase TrmI [Methanomassiliicoccales archaeon PtaU1.Bin124]
MWTEGDIVFLLDDKGKKFWLKLERGMIKLPSLGVIDGNKIIEAGDGGCVSLAGKNFTVLSPGVSDLMEAVERGAQIIMPKDAATIVFELDLKDGDVVVEAGLGSGALTTALLHSVEPTGKVISVELREDFGDKGRRNVAKTRSKRLWTLRIGDIRTIELEQKADAVVLDMPDPWVAVDNVSRFLRSGGRLCVYVPNTNQLELVVKKMRASGFVEVKALENIQRAMEVHDMGVRPSYEMLGHTGYLAFGRLACQAQKQ